MTGIVRCKCTFIALVLIAHLMPCVSHAEQPERVRVTAKQLFEALDLSRPGLRDVAEAVKKHDFSAAATAWTVYFRNREKPTLHFDRRVWAEFMQREFPQVAEAIVDKARRLAEGDISHGTIRFPVDGPLPGATIDWFHNPKRDTNYVSLVGSQWFLNPLGRAYLLTGNERYARAFAWVFESWFDHQEQIVQGQGGLGFEPIYRAYYPGIQTRILADNYYCLARSDALTPAVSLKIMRQLVANARFLANQERSYRRGNQQVAAVLGLGVVGLFLPELKQAPQWLQRAESLMIEHLEKDFYDDGGHKELCTQYHKTCLRDIGYVALMSECNGRPSPLLRGRSRQALERIYDWLARLVTPTGQTPPLHSAVFSTDYAIHLLVSATHFKRADHAWLARRFWDRGAVPCQKSPVAHVVYLLAPPLAPSMMQATQPPDYTSVHLDQSGFAILRSGWKMSDRYLVLQYGQANTGHAYPAALSFLLQTNGELIATHPGSPRSYRHPAYSYCKTTRAHNTVTLDGESYAKVKGIAPGGTLHHHASLPGLWYVDGSHDGYKAKKGAVHRRQIVALESGPILWLDEVRGGTARTAEWNFHTPLETEVIDDRRVRLEGKQPYELVSAQNNADIQQDRRWATLRPEACQPEDCGGEVNVLRFVRSIPTEGPAFAVALLGGGGDITALAPNAFRLRTAESEYTIVVDAAERPIKAAGIRAKARMAVLTRIANKLTDAWVVEGTQLTVEGRTILDAEKARTSRLDLPPP